MCVCARVGIYNHVQTIFLFSINTKNAHFFFPNFLIQHKLGHPCEGGVWWSYTRNTLWLLRSSLIMNMCPGCIYCNFGVNWTVAKNQMEKHNTDKSLRLLVVLSLYTKTCLSALIKTGSTTTESTLISRAATQLATAFCIVSSSYFSCLEHN